MRRLYGAPWLIIVALVLVVGCAENRYYDKTLGIEVQRIDADLENRWSTNGVVVRRIEAGSPAEGKLGEGELITHVVGRFDARSGKGVKRALERALDKDRFAILLLSDGREIPFGIRKRGEKPGMKLEGNRITSVEPGKAAALAGLKEGDQIEAIIDEKRITSIKDFKKALKEIRDYAPEVTFYTSELSVIKLAAIRALGMLGDKRALAPLLEVLEGAEPELRLPAAQALERLSEKVSSPELVEAMIRHLQDPDPEIRRSSASILGKLRVQKAIPTLLQALEDPVSGVRFRAGIALSQLGEPALDGLIQVLHTGSPVAQEIAASALGDIGGPRARAALMEMLRPGTRLSFQLSLVDALGRLARGGDAQALAALQQLAQSTTEAGVRVFVEELLGKLKEAST